MDTLRPLSRLDELTKFEVKPLGLQPDNPPWIIHLKQHHPQLAPLGHVIRLLRSRYLEWPKRNAIYQRLRHYGYPAVEAVDANLWLLHSLFESSDCEDSAHCGQPVFRFESSNPRGPATVAYGFDPFRDEIGRLEHLLWNDSLKGRFTFRSRIDIDVEKGVYGPSREPLDQTLVNWYLKRTHLPGYANEYRAVGYGVEER
jgi:hypothetical protein